MFLQRESDRVCMKRVVLVPMLIMIDAIPTSILCIVLYSSSHYYLNTTTNTTLHTMPARRVPIFGDKTYRPHNNSGLNFCLGGSPIGINDLMMTLVQPGKVFGSNMGLFLKMNGMLGKKAPCVGRRRR